MNNHQNTKGEIKMKNKIITKAMVILTALALTGMGTSALAGSRGMGYGHASILPNRLALRSLVALKCNPTRIHSSTKLH